MLEVECIRVELSEKDRERNNGNKSREEGEAYEGFSLHGDEEHGLGFGDEADSDRGRRRRRREPGAFGAGFALRKRFQVDRRREDAREVEEAREFHVPMVRDAGAWGMGGSEQGFFVASCKRQRSRHVSLFCALRLLSHSYVPFLSAVCFPRFAINDEDRNRSDSLVKCFYRWTPVFVSFHKLGKSPVL